MPKFVLNRDYNHLSPNGCISFKKGEPTSAPSYMTKELLQIGAELIDGVAPSLTPEEPKAPVIPEGGDRREQIMAAFALIVDRNESSDFTGSGRPSVKAVEKLTGFDVEPKEVSDAWDEFKVSMA